MSTILGKTSRRRYQLLIELFLIGRSAVQDHWRIGRASPGMENAPPPNHAARFSRGTARRRVHQAHRNSRLLVGRAVNAERSRIDETPAVMPPHNISRAGLARMRKLFGQIGSISRLTIESKALKTNMLGDPSARVVDV